jgi:acyl-CoA synthetase (AMP-forming)/AMP-acid ligase II/acyl carrier protein
MPLFHVHGLIGAALTSFAAGASIICSPGFDGPKFFEWMDVFQPTWYTAVPTMHQTVLAHGVANPKLVAKQHLRFIRSCSASLSPTVMTDLENLFKTPVIEAYGMTEASHQMTSNPLPPRHRKAGSVGVAAGSEVAIMDEGGNLLKPGTTGEIVVRGANVTRGYENDPIASEDSFINGWFRTGDQGVMDTEGYLVVTGRIKEMINRGGEKIAPREIDDRLLEHPAVAQAVTFALPHPTLGEDIVAAVVLKEKGSSTGEIEIREFLFGRLAGCKLPSQVVIVDQIPKGPTGKVQRIGLADKLFQKLKKPFVAPRTSVEETLAKIWVEVLGSGQVSVYDNFFALGGDSLKATLVVSRVQKAFDVTLTLKTFFLKPSVAGLATAIEDIILDQIEKMTDVEARRHSE